MLASYLTIYLSIPTAMKQKFNLHRCLPHVRFWPPGLIAVTARQRVGQLLRYSMKTEAQAMIDEWVV
jgi:hypothetical protein